MTQNPDLIQDVEDFHKRFAIPMRAVGQPFNQAVLAFRMEFLMEELHEFNTAVSSNPQKMHDALDALVDLVYVAIGTAYMLNLPFAKAWQAVQEKNMQKVRATDPSASKRGSDLDVVKPKGWTPPDIFALLPGEDQALVLEGAFKKVAEKPAGETIDLEEAIKNKENKSE